MGEETGRVIKACTLRGIVLAKLGFILCSIDVSRSFFRGSFLEYLPAKFFNFFNFWGLNIIWIKETNIWVGLDGACFISLRISLGSKRTAFFPLFMLWLIIIIRVLRRKIFVCISFMHILRLIRLSLRLIWIIVFLGNEHFSVFLVVAIPELIRLLKQLLVRALVVLLV